jgi:hypothetical protein
MLCGYHVLLYFTDLLFYYTEKYYRNMTCRFSQDLLYKSFQDPNVGGKIVNNKILRQQLSCQFAT